MEKRKRSVTPSIATIYEVPNILCDQSVVVDDGSGKWDYLLMQSFTKPLDYFLFFCGGMGIDKLVTATNSAMYGASTAIGFTILNLYKYIGALFILDSYPVI